VASDLVASVLEKYSFAFGEMAKRFNGLKQESVE